MRTYHTKDGRLLNDPDDMNEWRAEAAEVALRSFEEFGYEPNTEDDETILGDLLCDVRHFCDREGLDFDMLIERSRMHYTAETTTG
jgi:hypothetical protein